MDGKPKLMEVNKKLTTETKHQKRPAMKMINYLQKKKKKTTV